MIAPVPVLAKPGRATIKDDVPNVMVRKSWAIPGADSKDEPALEVAAAILGQIDGNRLYKELAIDRPLVEQVSTEVSEHAQGGVFNITAIDKEGVDPARSSGRSTAWSRASWPKAPRRTRCDG